MLSLKTEKFIEKARQLHGNKYDYSQVEYVHSKNKVKIICKHHGLFEQIPHNHLNGNGCKHCYFDNIRDNLDIFIEKASKIHGEKYDYSKVKYKSNKIPIKIGCNICNDVYEDIPLHHLEGRGCKKCHIHLSTKTNEDFIRDANNIHGSKYDYSLVNYTGVFVKIKIICKKHGEFLQTPNHHLNGRGCPNCFNKTEGKIRDFLTKNNIQFEQQYIVDGKKFDFLIKDEFILEIDGSQHFIGYEHLNTKILTDRKEIIDNDIKKMKSVINIYPVVRLYQENIWNDTYDWGNYLCKLSDLKSGILYIKTDERNIYKNHVIEFKTEYF
jgi:very-short-patch-repair endonuclease